MLAPNERWTALPRTVSALSVGGLTLTAIVVVGEVAMRALPVNLRV